MQLFSHREDVDAVNAAQLAALPGEAVRFLAQDDGRSPDAMQMACPVRTGPSEPPNVLHSLWLCFSHQNEHLPGQATQQVLRPTWSERASSKVDRQLRCLMLLYCGYEGCVHAFPAAPGTWRSVSPDG